MEIKVPDYQGGEGVGVKQVGWGNRKKGGSCERAVVGIGNPKAGKLELRKTT